MVEAVCDSSTLILLAKTGFLRYLEFYVDKILIPPEVYREVVVAGKSAGKEDAYVVEREVQKGKISVSKVRRGVAVGHLLQQFRLQVGEAEAIVLCIEKKALFLGIDDREGIKVCKVYAVPFVTALALVLRLAQEKAISIEEAKVALNKLEPFYSEDLIEEAKREIGGVGKWKV